MDERRGKEKWVKRGREGKKEDGKMKERDRRERYGIGREETKLMETKREGKEGGKSG